jgi:hypothetical protein
MGGTHYSTPTANLLQSQVVSLYPPPALKLFTPVSLPFLF